MPSDWPRRATRGIRKRIPHVACHSSDTMCCATSILAVPRLSTDFASIDIPHPSSGIACLYTVVSCATVINLVLSVVVNYISD